MRRFVRSTTLLLAFLCLVSSALAASDEFEARRLRMVKHDIERRGVRDPLVLQAMSKVPRHLFVAEGQKQQAYNDHPLPIGEGQTISQPYVVALMTEALKLTGGERVLELGTGSGYQAAVLAEIVKEVYTIEIRQGLYTMVSDRLQKLGYRNVQVKLGDGYFGWPEQAPFDAIIVTAAANHIPPPLLTQLKEGGRLIIPLGSTTFSQNLMLLTKEKGKQKMTELGGVRFVPLVGEAQKK